jgi:hypothetical protein
MNETFAENKELIKIIYLDSKSDENARKQTSMLQEINDYVLLISNDHINRRIRFNGTLKILLFIA